MQVHTDIDKLPGFKNAVITIGTFDGVHLGHQKIIDALIKETRKIDGESVIITFHPHPKKIVQPHYSLQLINTLDEKVSLLKEKNIDHLVIVPFTADFAELTAEAYIEEFLIRKFNPHTIIIGYDHHFGKGRKGNLVLLEQQQKLWNYNLIEIPKHILNEIGISSTKIRYSILNSYIKKANDLLGYPFFFSGKVIKGDKIGRKLGYPTANLEYTNDDKIHLGDGVYAVEVEGDDFQKNGMLSIGTRPTLNNSSTRTEVNIFDFDIDIYGSELKVIVHAYLREQIKYNNLEELTKQLHRDKEATSKYFLNHKAF
jgi:riboflavin kinase / FMN adenylyltransferase